MAGGLGAGRDAGRGGPAGRSSNRASSSRRFPRSRISHKADSPLGPVPRSRFTNRRSHRLATRVSPAVRAALERTTRSTAKSSAASCASVPMARSGGGRPSPARMDRLSQGSSPRAPGAVSSFRPPKMTMSGGSKRAERVLSMVTLGWPPGGTYPTWAWITSSAIRSGYSLGVNSPIAGASSHSASSSLRTGLRLGECAEAASSRSRTWRWAPSMSWKDADPLPAKCARGSHSSSRPASQASSSSARGGAVVGSGRPQAQGFAKACHAWELGGLATENPFSM